MKYQANPVIVDAFKITKVIGELKVGSSCDLEIDNGQVVKASWEMLARMKPQVGDYWVIQSDGYIYLNPKEVFERKYRRYELDATNIPELAGGLS
jgi:hypothetical protein